MKLTRAGQSAFTLTVSAPELSALVAAVRLAADVLTHNQQTPPEALAHLHALLSDYERAIARLNEQDGHQGHRS